MPRDPDRITPLLERLNRAWSSNSDLRLGQIFSNLLRAMQASLFFVEDEKLIGSIEEMLGIPGDELMAKECGRFVDKSTGPAT